jgi:hypothetical protein
MRLQELPHLAITRRGASVDLTNIAHNVPDNNNPYFLCFRTASVTLATRLSAGNPTTNSA